MTTKEKKDSIATPLRGHKTDTGSTAVQIAVLTAEIIDLTGHLNANKKDYSSRIGLLKKVGQRRRLLNYLGRIDVQQYKKVISELKLRK